MTFRPNRGVPFVNTGDTISEDCEPVFSDQHDVAAIFHNGGKVETPADWTTNERINGWMIYNSVDKRHIEGALNHAMRRVQPFWVNMIKSALLILLLAGCADYYASQYQPTSPIPSTLDKSAAFQACNRKTWQEWAGKPHLAYAFGAVGALADDAYTSEPSRDQLSRCMATHGYAKSG